MTDTFKTRAQLTTASGTYTLYRLDKLEAARERLDRLPYSIRVLLEGALRNCDGSELARQEVLALAGWQPQQTERPAISFYPGRVVMQDFSGVPVTNDLAGMRAALARLGGDPKKINPVIPVDIVIDHSLQVDFAGSPDALKKNAQIEFERNRERYEFLHWAQKAFKNFRVVPPATGIIHQINVEYLAQGVLTRAGDDETLAFPDTVIGTDSHTPMVNGLGVVGWGVGGIEAVAAMLGEPLDLLMPDVVGFKLSGQLREGVTATDATLTIVQILRKQGVVDKFVEFYGPGLDSLPVAERNMIANMSPEHGATVSYFPVDQHTLDYLRLTGRPAETVELVEAYCKAQHLFRTAAAPDPEFTLTLELDLSMVEPSLAGPKRPQDRVALGNVQAGFKEALTKTRKEGGYNVAPEDVAQTVALELNGAQTTLGHGAIVIAAITSCTNTSTPSVLIGAGLLAKKAVEKGLTTKPYIKTSFAPGSRVVTAYLEQAGLIGPLETLGFHVVGYGCTTCIGNSGPLPEPIVNAIQTGKLVVGAVLSGNRNFEGRVSPHTQANYLASPPLVVAYALAGTLDIDLTHDSLGTDKEGQPVYLRDLWPSQAEIETTLQQYVRPELYQEKYAAVFTHNAQWNAIQSSASELYKWHADSTYLHEPPFFLSMRRKAPPVQDIVNARVLAMFGDSVTTDHISPAGDIPADSPAGKYLILQGVVKRDFNAYGARRGNDEVLTRGTFANIRIKNLLLPGTEGSVTLHLPDGAQMNFYEAAMNYQDEGVPLVILSGKEYGTGSSRDWAAKGPLLLGVRAVIAESFERIHRSNLIGMGILPLQFQPGQNAASLKLTGRETFSIKGLATALTPAADIMVQATREDGRTFTFVATARLNTPGEVEIFRLGGIMQKALYAQL